MTQTTSPDLAALYFFICGDVKNYIFYVQIKSLCHMKNFELAIADVGIGT